MAMRRRLLDYETALSLVLLVATVASWVRSYFVSDIVAYVHAHHGAKIKE